MQASAVGGWYQNSRAASPQEKEKEAPQAKADNAVKVSISQEGIEGYRNGTRERYVEDENSETGFRKMTMEEELSGLDRAFQKMADRADTREMIEGDMEKVLSLLSSMFHISSKA